MTTVLLLLSKGSALLPYIAALLSPTIWAIVSRGLPLVTRLVRAYESDPTIPGRDKAVKVIEETLALLEGEGFIIDARWDWIIQVMVELSLVLLRRSSVEANKSKVIKHIRLV